MHDRVSGSERDPQDLLIPHVVVASRFSGPSAPSVGSDQRSWVTSADAPGSGRLMGPALPGEVTATALREIGQRFRESDVLDLIEMSPLLPRLDIQEDIDGRDDAIKHGVRWLQALFAQPRKRLRTVAEVTHVARSRRVTPRSMVHLAGHSELWGRKTVRGVEPLRLLSERPEDDLDIYENRVARSALQDSCTHLDRRLQAVVDVDDYMHRLEAVIDRLRDRPWRVTRRLSLLLEEAIPEPSERLAISDRRKQLAELRRQLGALQDDPLTRAVRPVPGSSSEIRWTNLLSDDARYRRAAELWLRLRPDRAPVTQDRVDPIEPLLSDLTAYCCLLLIRALHDADWFPSTEWQPRAGTSTRFEKEGSRASLGWTDDNALLLDVGGRRVRLVPLVQPLRQVNDVVALQSFLDDVRRALPAEETVVLLYPGDGSVPPEWPAGLAVRLCSLPGEALASEPLGALPVGPLEADSSERVQRLINGLTYGLTWQTGYPGRLSAPAPLLATVADASGGAIALASQEALLMRPMTLGEQAGITRVLQAAAVREEAQRQIRTRQPTRSPSS